MPRNDLKDSSSVNGHCLLYAGVIPVGNMVIQNPKQLGAAIRARRKQLKVTQKYLALTRGAGLRFIIDLEKGKPTCQVGKALQVLQALGLRLRINPATDQDEM